LRALNFERVDKDERNRRYRELVIVLTERGEAKQKICGVPPETAPAANSKKAVREEDTKV